MRTIPEPNKHLVHFYGAYANRVRSTLRPDDDGAQDRAKQSPTERRVRRKRWAELIYRIYEVDPLTSRRCRAQMKTLAFVSEPALIRKILDHLEKIARPRAPPETSELYVH